MCNGFMVREVNNPTWYGKLFFNLSMKSTLSLFFVLFLSLGLLVTIQQVMVRQDVRQQAASDNIKSIQEDFIGGTYEFIVDNNNVLLVSVDEHVIYDNLNQSGAASKQFTTTISSGRHTINISYSRNNTDPALQVSWRKL